MEAINDPEVDEVVIMTSAQVGKTEVLLNAIGFYISHDPSPILIVQPTLEMAQAFSKDRLAPMLRDTPALKGKVKDARSRDSNNTTLQKVFPGGRISISGANSPASLASRAIRIVLCDESDRYPASASTEGDPISLARKRSATFHNRKCVLTSTPTVKGASRIETAFEASDQRRFFLPCPHCGIFDHLTWKQVHWSEGRPEQAAIVCSSCGSVWTEAERLKALRLGEWRAAAPFKGIAGFHLNALYSPWTRLSEIAKEFIEAKKLPDRLKVFVNTVLGESWEDAGEQVDDHGLFARREEFEQPIPREVVVITAGIDVQDDRIEVETIGWGRDEETWSLDYRTIYGDPTSPPIWQELDTHLLQTFEHPTGIELPVKAVCIDSGHHTNAVYSFVKPREGRRIFAIKGVGGESKPLVGRPTKNNIGKVRLFPIGVNTAKELLFSRLRITEAGPGYCHFPMERDE